MTVNVPQHQRQLRRQLRKIAAPFQKFADLRKSAKIDVSGLRSVCLLLGPYRNLTTLTASILALHPNCQVLNHAGIRIFGDSRLDFLEAYTSQKFLDFTKFAIQISQGGRRGTYGGSILFSHAFDESYPVRQLYRRRYGDRLVKDKTYSLVWKESLRLSNHIKAGSGLTGIFAQNRALRFMLPVRNPIDCAFSNMRTGHVKIFPNLDHASGVEEVIAAILDDFAWFIELKNTHPTRFTYFFEHEFGENKLIEIAGYLELPVDDRWREDALSVFVDQSKSKYQHSAELVSFYIRQVEEKFAAHPEFRGGLLKFVE